MLWIVLMCICIIAAIYLAICGEDILTYFAAGGALLFLILFFAVPVKGYMDVETTHWYWTVDIMQYKQVSNHKSTGHHDYPEGARNEAKRNIPSDAYSISIMVEPRSETHHDDDGNTWSTTYYVADYSYIVDRWVKVSEVSSCGNDKEPYEPERPYPSNVDNVLGNCKCAAGHSELYTVTGIVDNENKTYNVDKSDWNEIDNYDEFSYKKYRFGHRIWDLKFAE